MPITPSCALFGALFLLSLLFQEEHFYFLSFNELVFIVASGGIHIF